MTAATHAPTTSEILVEVANDTGLPVISFEDLATRFRKERRIDVRDALSARNHFANWHRRRRLPIVDDAGVHRNASRIYFGMYREDPDGEHSRPPQADLWHWLIDAYTGFPWDETDSRRTKAVPVIRGMVAIPVPPTDGEITATRTRLEAVDGPLPEEAWAPIELLMRQRTAVASRIAELVDAATDWHGGMFILTMSVDR